MRGALAVVDDLSELNSVLRTAFNINCDRCLGLSNIVDRSAGDSAGQQLFAACNLLLLQKSGLQNTAAQILKIPHQEGLTLQGA
ncbi:hypothetical protein SAMN05216345_13211 [Cupriavidus sp. YR651]|nr:hypothetical protein SAMN05216345_13211 [Cupriavidus sp. YR651]